MIKKYFEPPYPMQDGRDSIPRDETIASWAAKIIRGNLGDDELCYAQKKMVVIPKPNKSARIRSRSKLGLVEVEGSKEFFFEVEVFVDKIMRLINS